jgi:hypothetical protein
VPAPNKMTSKIADAARLTAAAFRVPGRGLAEVERGICSVASVSALDACIICTTRVDAATQL